MFLAKLLEFLKKMPAGRVPTKVVGHPKKGAKHPKNKKWFVATLEQISTFYRRIFLCFSQQVSCFSVGLVFYVSSFSVGLPPSQHTGFCSRSKCEGGEGGEGQAGKLGILILYPALHLAHEQTPALMLPQNDL